MTARYLVWSNKHKSWWGPHWAGYTPLIEAAGRYELDEARRIVDKSTEHGELKYEVPNPYAWQGQPETLTAYDTVMVLAPESIATSVPESQGETHV